MNRDGRNDPASVSMNAPAETPCWPGSSPGAEQRALVYEAIRALPDKIAPVVALVEKIAQSRGSRTAG